MKKTADQVLPVLDISGRRKRNIGQNGKRAQMWNEYCITCACRYWERAACRSLAWPYWPASVISLNKDNPIANLSLFLLFHFEDKTQSILGYNSSKTNPFMVEYINRQGDSMLGMFGNFRCDPHCWHKTSFTNCCQIKES